MADMTYAALAYSTIAKGRILELDISEAAASAGIALVMTHQNAPRLTPPPVFLSEQKAAGGDSLPVMRALPLEMQHWSMHSHAAMFCEVRVNAVTGEPRIGRFLGSFDCGRILNPKTAASQFRGGIIMGMGLALMEETQIDERNGRVMNPSLAEYHVPVHMDVPEIDVIWTDIPDPHTPMGASWHWRDRDHRHRGGNCQRDLQRNGQARARASHHAGQADVTASGSPASCRHSKISTDRSKPFADLLAGFIRAHARLPYSWPSSAKLHAATSAASASDRYKLMMFAGVAWVGCRSVRHEARTLRRGDRTVPGTDRRPRADIVL
ncbi:hypothetical protein J2X65_004698 [Ancylobacter sp. 3268]|nr:hypothetical protein [Ancylobacter sp. 3268]